MDLADDIAYGVHDLEDAITLGLVTKESFFTYTDQFDKSWSREQKLGNVGNQLFSDEPTLRKQAVGALVNAFIVCSEVEKDKGYKSRLLKYKVVLPEEASHALGLLKELVVEKVIKIPEVSTLEFRGQHIILHLFEALASDPKRLLTCRFKKLWSEANDTSAQMRVVCDYVAGMTDEYATRLYERLFVPRQGTVFQKM